MSWMLIVVGAIIQMQDVFWVKESLLQLELRAERLTALGARGSLASRLTNKPNAEQMQY